MKRAVILIAAGVALLLCAALLYRHFTRSKQAETAGWPESPSPSAAQLQAVPDTAELYSFFWNQSGENADACFTFSFGTAQEDGSANGHYLNCTFQTPDGEAVEQKDLPISEECWHELETALRPLSLPSYAPPDPNLLDAADSCVEICWAENGSRFTNRYNGEYAHELHAFLMTYIGQIAN